MKPSSCSCLSVFARKAHPMPGSKRLIYRNARCRIIGNLKKDNRIDFYINGGFRILNTRTFKSKKANQLL